MGIFQTLSIPSLN